MAFLLYVNKLPQGITLENLIIYFQSSKSGGGDVDSDACRMLDGNQAVVVFEEKEYLDNVLKRDHEIHGQKLEISDKQFKFKPVPKKRAKKPQTTAQQKSQHGNTKDHPSEVRTVTVSGISKDTTDKLLELFFESSKKSGGGDIEKVERHQPDVANITFVSAEVAANVLKRNNLELEGYRLDLKPKHSELVPSSDRKQLKSQHDNRKDHLVEVRTVIVSGISKDTTDSLLELFFENSKKSGGGDIEKIERHQPDVANITFVSAAVAANVLKQDKLELEGYHLNLKPKHPGLAPSLDRKKLVRPHDNEKAYLGEVRTVIVSGISPDTTDDLLLMFFENGRRSGGGTMEKLERRQPDVAHITFDSAEVAANVLKQNHLELNGYRLQLKEQQPELFLPLNRKKLYIENIEPSTTKDSLSNYIEVVTKLDVSDLQFGSGTSRNALATFQKEPDMQKVLKYKKPLEGTFLKITNPPVCNSILVTGLSEKTSKQAIEMYFENEKNGGGKIYGDVIYQKDHQRAVVSFCDPEVVKSIITRTKLQLDGCVLSVTKHFQFMNPITETSYQKIRLNMDVNDHIIQNYEKEVRDLFSEKTLKILKGNQEEITLPPEMAEEFEQYMKNFIVKVLLFSKNLLDNFEEEISVMITKAAAMNATVTLKCEIPQIKIVGKETDVNKIHEQLKSEISKMEDALNVVTQSIELPERKIQLFVLHDLDKLISNEFHVELNIEPGKNSIVIKGAQTQVLLAQNGILQKFTRFAEDKYDLTETRKSFLKSGGTRILNNGMKEIGLRGMILSNGAKSNKAKLLAFEDAKIKEVISFLKENMFERKYLLEEESITLLNSNKWEEFCENVEKNTSVRVTADKGTPTQVFLIGKKREVESTYQTLEKFMKRNTIVNLRIDLNEGYAGYLKEYCTKDLEDIEKKLEEQNVRVQFVVDEEAIRIDGTKDGARAAKEGIDDILSNIATDKIRLDKQRMQTYLQSEEGKAFLEVIESKHKCKILVTDDNGNGPTKILSKQPNSASKLLCSYETKEKISLKVYKGNITEHACDVIVNAANGDLKHIGGVAKSILDAGGREIQDECDTFVNKHGRLFDGECFSGRPGKLPCKRLVHAVGPRWDNSKRESVRKTLLVTCIKALEEAIDYRSIALPAIGSGVFGIPKEVCADIMIQAAEEFSTKHRNCALKEIHFVNNDDNTGGVFSKKFREKFGGRRSFKTSDQTASSRGRFDSSKVRFSSQKKTADKPKPDDARDVPRRKSGDFIVTRKNMTISVVVGDLSTHKADVLVNTTGEALNLQSNPCSQALSNEAGPTLQAECTQIGKLQVGKVAATKGGNLLCDDVYHVVCVQWNGGQGEKVLRAIIKGCLKKCNSSGKKSIAFPAIGTGTLGFPHDVAARVFFEETKDFENRVANCDIKEVSFVVYSQDTQSIQAFKSELQRQAEWNTTTPTANAPAVSQQRWRRMPATPQRAENGVMCIEVVDSKKVEIVKGDITKEETDVIAHLTNQKLFMGSGVATALVRAGGNEIELECKDKDYDAELQVATTVLTTAGHLNANRIAHMVASNNPDSHEIQKCISDCLKTVSEKEYQSMSLPAVGTGSLKKDVDKAAKTIITSIVRFLESSSGPLTTVRIVLKDDDVVTAFQACAKKLREEDEPGMFRRIVNYLWKSESPSITLKETPSPMKKVIFLEIYAADNNTIKCVKEKVLKIIESQKERKLIEDSNIEKLSDKQIDEIEVLCELNDVKVTVEKYLKRIVVSGHTDDVSKAKEEISQILKDVSEAEKEKEKEDLQAYLAEIVSQGVQWFYEDPQTGDYEEYDKSTNATIEKAYSKKEKSVIFCLQDGKCEIVFDKLEERNLDKVTRKKLKVTRKDLKAQVSLPDYWEAQPQDASGKELDVHLVALDPKNPKHKDEYKKISDHFLQTASQQIGQIQRIQNPSLLKQYLMKKATLDEKSGSNEKFLFHGTSSNSLTQINKHGLNRSYAGNAHGTAVGRGVYFARDASMSVGYAPQCMQTGKRYMYWARAAVGQYAVGNSSMLVPPQKAGGNNDSYDSTVNNVTNPTIFVLFYDYQCYPEYLITFT